MNTYTTTWNYIASGFNFLIEKQVWIVDNESGIEQCKIPEGVRLILIVTCASVVEGALKTYLIETINATFREKDRIENLINNDIHNPEAQIKESESTFFNAPTKEELINRKDENDKLFVRIKNISIEQVEKQTWRNLTKIFNEITGENLKDLLNDRRKGLFEDVQKIMDFRNFVIHSNNIQHKIYKENDISYQGKSKRLIEYLKNNKLLENNYRTDGKDFIEHLIPAKLIHHFKKTLDEYLDVNFFKGCIDTKNLVNLIYNE